MSTTLILAQDCIVRDAASVERWITAETNALASELFCTTFGLDRDGAWDRAIELLPDLLAYAAAWDADAAPPVVFALEAAHAAT
jgi:hypothetical protein